MHENGTSPMHTLVVCLHHAMHNSCAGDHGDRDLELALQRIHAAGRKVPLVVFGHMHEKLRGTSSLRNMVEVDASTGTVYLNTAVVPRIGKMEVAGRQVSCLHAQPCHMTGNCQQLRAKRIKAALYDDENMPGKTYSFSIYACWIPEGVFDLHRWNNATSA